MEIGDYVIIGHSVVVHGKRIGNNNLIGNNATVLENSVIGNFCIVGAGCVVSPGMNIPDYSLVLGVPAKVKGRIGEDQMRRLERGSVFYAGLLKTYKEEGL
jgi:carbonic anhydrase/acetyltransferase-like protein (isoleucine patch superfamily)